MIIIIIILLSIIIILTTALLGKVFRRRLLPFLRAPHDNNTGHWTVAPDIGTFFDRSGRHDLAPTPVSLCSVPRLPDTNKVRREARSRLRKFYAYFGAASCTDHPQAVFFFFSSLPFSRPRLIWVPQATPAGLPTARPPSICLDLRGYLYMHGWRLHGTRIPQGREEDRLRREEEGRKEEKATATNPRRQICFFFVFSFLLSFPREPRMNVGKKQGE